VSGIFWPTVPLTSTTEGRRNRHALRHSSTIPNLRADPRPEGRRGQSTAAVAGARRVFNPQVDGRPLYSMLSPRHAGYEGQSSPSNPGK